MSARAVPLAVPDVKIDWLADVEPILDRGPYGGYGVYRPGPYYGAGPYTHYRPFYGDRPYYRPYDRPYVRPGVQVYIAPRPVYRDRYVVPGGSHVNWCVSRYRSYNPATNRFLAYGGVYKICRSPYR